MGDIHVLNYVGLDFDGNYGHVNASKRLTN